MSEPTNMRGLPYVPLDPQWLAESPAFVSSNPKLVRAVLRLLTHAWSSVPAGTLPTSFLALANIANLTEMEVGEHHEELFHGWELVEGRLRFLPMSSLCERISARYGDTLSTIADQSAAVMQSPEDFVLTPSEVTRQTKGKRRLPKNWQPSVELRQWMVVNGFEDVRDQEFVLSKFTSYHLSKGDLMLDWDQAFQNFALKENRNGLPSNASRLPLMQFSPGSRAARFGTAGTQAREHNTGVFDRAAGRMRGESSHA
jgi:hypothetical protein